MPSLPKILAKILAIGEVQNPVVDQGVDEVQEIGSSTMKGTVSSLVISEGEAADADPSKTTSLCAYYSMFSEFDEDETKYLTINKNTIGHYTKTGNVTVATRTRLTLLTLLPELQLEIFDHL